MAFLNIEHKEDSPEKLAAIVGKPHNQFLFAGELNETVEKINELAAMVPSAIITTGTVTFDEIERKATVSGFGYRLAGARDYASVLLWEYSVGCSSYCIFNI